MNASDPTPTPPAAHWESDIGQLISLGNLIEAKVAHEINLVGQRMTWMVISESFLFSAFATTLSASGRAPVSELVSELLWLLPVFGIALVCCVYPSLLAARAVIRALDVQRGEIEVRLRKLTLHKLPILGTVERDKNLRWTVWAGDLSMLGVPLVICVPWAAVLVSRLRG